MKYLILAALFVVLAAPAHAGRTGDKFNEWTIRCEGEGKAQACEAFQSLTLVETGQRVFEFAVSYPQIKQDVVRDAKAISPPSVAAAMAMDIPARGVIVLPLGIMLTDGVSLVVDKSSRYSFEVRYCTPEGCYAYITLPRATVEQMDRGMAAAITFRTLDKKKMSLPLSLKGFGSALQATK